MHADAAKFVCRIAIGGVFVATRGNTVIGCLSTFRPRWANADALDEIIADCPSAMIGLPAAARWRAACARWRLPHDWHAATADGTLADGALHRGDGEVVFGVGVATDPRARGTHVAQALLGHALDDARASGARYFLGYSRLPQYHASVLGLDAYLRLGRPGPTPHDFGLRLHWAVGAKPASTREGRSCWVGIPASMHDDPESRGAGVLVVNPLR